MENFFKTPKGILAGLLAILFIGTTPLALAFYNVEQNAFDTGLYIQALEDENIYQRLPELAVQALANAAQAPERNDLLSLFRNLSEEEWRVFIIGLLPPGELKIMAEDAVMQVLAYLNGESNKVVLSLARLKTHLQSPEGVSAIYGMLKAQPDCTVEQVTAMALGQQHMTLCNPPDTFLFVDLRPIIAAQIRSAVGLLPEQVSIISANADRVQELQNLKNVRLVMRLSPILPLLCLLAVAVLAVRSLKDWLNWWGYPLLVAGLISLSLTALSRPLAALMFKSLIVPVLPVSLSPYILDVFKDLVTSIVYHAVQPTFKIAGIIALIGLIMVGLTFLLRRDSAKYDSGRK